MKRIISTNGKEKNNYIMDDCQQKEKMITTEKKEEQNTYRCMIYMYCEQLRISAWHIVPIIEHNINDFHIKFNVIIKECVVLSFEKWTSLL